MTMGSVQAQRMCAVFSLIEKKKSEYGTKPFLRKQYFFIEKELDGSMTIQPLNVNQLPTGRRIPITAQELLEKYIPEPQFFSQVVSPRMRELERTLDKGDSYRKKEQHFSATCEYNTALQLDEENIRATFGKGLVSLAQGELAQAEAIFKRLVKMEAAFEPKHKHLFNEFGMNLRKNGMHKQSVAYYMRALELSKDDENLHINIARPLFELGHYSSCIEHLMESLQLAPGNETAMKFLRWMERSQCVPTDFLPKVQTLLFAYTIPSPIGSSGIGLLAMPADLEDEDPLDFLPGAK